MFYFIKSESNQIWNRSLLWKDEAACPMFENLSSCICLTLHLSAQLVGFKSRWSHYDKLVDCPAFQSEWPVWILGRTGFIFSLFCERVSPQLESNLKVSLSGRSGIKWKLNMGTQMDLYTTEAPFETMRVSPKICDSYLWNTVHWRHWF